MAINSQILLQTILKQIDSALEKWGELEKYKSDGYMRDYYYKISDAQIQQVITTLASTINRLSPIGSRYREDVQAAFEYFRQRRGDNPEVIDRLAGILKALRSDYEAGFLRSVEEIIHADMFADFMEMASYFLEQGHKDPAAVIAGGVLEEHLRKLCLKNGLPIEDVTPKGNVPKMAGRLNDDLAGQNVYSKLDQKSAIAWIDLRNKAAHGRYTEYTKEQVQLMVQGIQDFLTRFPA